MTKPPEPFSMKTPSERILDELNASKELEAIKERDNEEADLAQSWRPKDLTDALNGVRDHPPSVLARVDGKHLIYPGRIHWFMGEPESLKSWLAQVAVAQELAAGNWVLYVDYEDNEGPVVDRLLGLGAGTENIRERFKYIKPETQLGKGDKKVTVASSVFKEVLYEHPWTLAVVDGVTDSVSLESLDLNDNVEVADWLNRIPKRIQRTGAAVICIDHVTKALDGRGRFAIGAQHKLAGLDGAAFMIENIRPLARADTEPVEGKSRINVGKDRPGWVRGVSFEKKMAGTFEITAYPDGTFDAGITTAQYQPEPPLEIVTAVGATLDRFGGEDSESHLVKHTVEYTESEIIDALTWMMEKKWVTTGKSGNSTKYELTSKGRAEL